MARTIPKYQRVYINGYDLSGDTRSIGALGWDYAFTEERGLTWEIAGGMCGTPTVTTGTLNTMLSATNPAVATDPHTIINNLQAGWANVLIALGFGAAPAIGDPAWLAVMEVKKITTTPGDSGFITTTIDFSPTNLDSLLTANKLNYDKPWGKLIHPYGAETGANSANTNSNNGAASTAGGWLMWHIYSIAGGAGTATVSIDESDTGAGAWGALSGATSGAIAYNAVPASGIVQLATNASIKSYLRPQQALAGGATSVTYALAFVRGR